MNLAEVSARPISFVELLRFVSDLRTKQMGRRAIWIIPTTGGRPPHTLIPPALAGSARLVCPRS
jgi:hypothetical protein